MEDRIVLVLEDATEVKGLVKSFDPSTQRTVSLGEVDERGSVIEIHDVAVERIRAAFFVHDLAFYRRYRLPERLGPPEAQVHPLNGEVRMWLELEWGQRLHGLLRPYDDEGRWYDFVPVGPDRAGNLIRALIAADAIIEAEAMSEE